MIETLLGGLLGGAFRLAPEILGHQMWDGYWVANLAFD